MKLSQEKNEILDKLNFISIDKISKKTVPDSPGIYFFRLKDNSQFNKNNEADIYVSDDTTLINYLGKKNLSVSITKNEILSSQLN